ncbi:MAG: TIGR03013 family PEP-CTERM/XrtA system glycosyltransferase [Thiobacillaceae bacterium]|jgi:sugar transferase (PEP-CTERM system associated)|nr:TIGR03013 family PEP-CTERM/XrtA system glycosyltransferase [Thiobacillaceae bacterium]
MIRFFRHYVPASMLFLVLVEFVLFHVVSRYAAVHYASPDTLLLASAGLAVYKPWLFAALMTLVIAVFGLYEWEWTKGIRSLLVRVLGCFAVGLVLLGLGAEILPSLFPAGGELAAVLVISCLGALLLRLLFLQWNHASGFKKRVLILGTGSRAAKVEDMIQAGQVLGLDIVGYLPMGGTHHYVPHARILDESGSLLDIVDRYGIEEIVVAIRERRGGGLPIAELLECKMRGTRILDLPAFFERQTGILPLESVNASWMIFAEGFHSGTLRDVVKRAFDLGVSGLMLLATLPIMLVTALAIKLESKGPVFYTQERIGESGEPFTIYKFRSMFTDAEKDGLPQWARLNDDRTTRVGRIIRRTRIDELPQLINVFLGHMSFVGPRPERPYFVQELSAQIPYYNTRHSVKPGITGWAQVRFPYGASVEDAIGKLQYDLYYVKNHSLFLDLMILLQTAQVVVLGKGVR